LNGLFYNAERIRQAARQVISLPRSPVWSPVRRPVRCPVRWPVRLPFGILIAVILCRPPCAYLASCHVGRQDSPDPFSGECRLRTVANCREI